MSRFRLCSEIDLAKRVRSAKAGIAFRSTRPLKKTVNPPYLSTAFAIFNAFTEFFREAGFVYCVRSSTLQAQHFKR